MIRNIRPWALRVAGWIITLTGAAILILNGGFGTDRNNPLPWIGAVTFVLGMIVTSTSSLISVLNHRRMLRQKIAEAHAIAHPPTPAKPD